MIQQHKRRVVGDRGVRQVAPWLVGVGLLLGAGCTGSTDSGSSGQAGAVDASATRTALAGGPSATPGLNAQASPVPVPAVADISPTQVALGDVVLSMVIEQPRHMLDQVALATIDPARQAAADPSRGPVSQGAVVLSEMIHVANNLDPTQPPPLDGAQAILRHVQVQVRTKDGGQPVPYLGVTMDVLLDGHPVQFGQALVPMLADGSPAPNVYYGNNVRLPQRGTYQVFVRMSDSPLLDKEQPHAAQFNLLLH